MLPYLLVYKSTFYDRNFSPKDGRRLIQKSYAKKKNCFWGLENGDRPIHEFDLYTSKYGTWTLYSPYSLLNRFIQIDMSKTLVGKHYKDSTVKTKLG